MAEVIPYDGAPPVVSVLEVLDRALRSGISTENLERILALQERFEANEQLKRKEEARIAFADAKAQFRAMNVVVVKDATVDFTSDKGRTLYNHASLGGGAEALGPPLAACGFDWRWETSQELDARGQMTITVECVLSHRMGHSERAGMFGPPDTKGGKAALEALQSTITRLQRYTLFAVTGTATKELLGVSDEQPEPQAIEDPVRQALFDTLQAAALEGMPAYAQVWKDLNRSERELIGPANHSEFNRRAAEVSAAAKREAAARGEGSQAPQHQPVTLPYLNNQLAAAKTAEQLTEFLDIVRTLRGTGELDEKTFVDVTERASGKLRALGTPDA